MSNIEIQTTQNIAVSYKAATITERGIATLVDYLIFFAYYFICIIILSNYRGDVSAFIGLVMGIPVLLYDLFMEYFTDGKSVGKMLMNIKVVSVDGKKPTLGQYFMRHVFRVMEGLASFFAVGSAALFINGKGQRLGDIAAGTAVVKMARTTGLHHTILHSIDPNYELVFPQVKRLSDQDISTIYDVIKTVKKTKQYHMLNQLADRLKFVLGVTPKMNDFEFIDTVVKDYSNYKFD